MTVLILALSAAYLLALIVENRRLERARRKLRHVIHVNGTRGKSTVCRLIDAGLRAGGWRVFCKTTGTDPMTIDVGNEEKSIHRRGRPNIKEQIGIVMQAASQGAEVLVAECMALQPELQYTAQHRILRADIGVITNVRRDHTDVMGETPEEICAALCNTVPKGGILFTAERDRAAQLAAAAEKSGSRFVAAYPGGDEPDFDFRENIALALAVCEHLGVPADIALAGMAHFRRDPYALCTYRVGEGLWINALSVNDVDSTCMVWEQLREKYALTDKKLILLINNRPDRGSRTRDMLLLCERLKPACVWLMGASRGYMAARLKRRNIKYRRLSGVKALRRDDAGADEVVFAVGNIALDGRKLVGFMREEGTRVV